MAKYRKKPVVIEATQWFKDGDHPMVEMTWFDRDGAPRWSVKEMPTFQATGYTQRPLVKTLEGWHEVTPGDYIITGVKGEHYPCKPDIFEATYEPAE